MSFRFEESSEKLEYRQNNGLKRFDLSKSSQYRSNYRNYNRFWLCKKCLQVYWKGSHWNNINDTLLKVKQLINLKDTNYS